MVTNVCMSQQKLGMSQIPLLYFFFKAQSLMEIKSVAEVTWGHANHLKADLDFCLMSIPGVSHHSLLYAYLSLEIPGTKKKKQAVSFSLRWSLK